MTPVGSNLDAIAALKRRGAEMSVGIWAGPFLGHAGPISAVISAPGSSYHLTRFYISIHSEI